MTALPRRPWLRLLVATLSRGVLAIVVSLALWAAAPAAIGWQPTTVSSGSMTPRLEIGDVAVTKPLSTLPALQQVLLVSDPDHPGRLGLYRFVGVDEQGRMVTRGDANVADDPARITPADVRGVAVLRVPYVGRPVVWIREDRYLLLSLLAAALVLLVLGAGLHREDSARTAVPRRRSVRVVRWSTNTGVR